MMKTTNETLISLPQLETARKRPELNWKQRKNQETRSSDDSLAGIGTVTSKRGFNQDVELVAGVASEWPTDG
ncbi:hypothetical protein V6N13_108755 [Hibiscus sabdariffa]